MGVKTEFDQAMEAVIEHKVISCLKASDDLICECHPISCREVAEYLERHDTSRRPLEEILDALCIAQGCGTCLDKALQFIETMRRKGKEMGK